MNLTGWQKHAGESWAAALTMANALEQQILVRESAAVEPLASALLDHDRDLTQLAATLLFRLDAERARTAAETAILAGKFFSDVTAFTDAQKLAEAMCDHGSSALLLRLRADKGVQYVLGAQQTLVRTDVARVRGAALPPARPQSEEVREELCKALGQQGGHSAFETLAQVALNDQDWGVRLAAVRALGVLGDPRGAAVVEQIVEARPAAFVRNTAVIIGHVRECLEALGRPPSPELLARIETFNAKRGGRTG